MSNRRHPNHSKCAIAKALRQAATPAERAAWEMLRDRGCYGLKFRRQYVIRGFILDFYCPELRLALEIDGAVHDSPEAMSRDAARTRALEQEGVTVLRIRNEDLDHARLLNLLRPFACTSVRRPNAGSPSPFHGEGDRG